MNSIKFWLKPSALLPLVFGVTVLGVIGTSTFQTFNQCEYHLDKKKNKDGAD